MSFKLLEIGMDALRRVRIGRAALAAAAICTALAPTPSFAQTIDGDHTISADTKLTEDVTVNGQLILDGAALDLNGHKLTVKGVTGQGVITDTLNDQYALYQELTYLESTTEGRQFIDNGYIHSTRSNVHIKFRHPSYPKNYTWFSYFGGGGRDAQYSFGGWIVYTSGKYYHWKSLGTSEGTWAGSSANTDYHLFIRKSSAAGDSGNCYVANANNSGVVGGAAGVVKASATEWPADVTPVTAYLFGHHNLNGTLNSAYVGSRIYLCEIKDGGTDAANLVRNFIPMKRRADDKPGMMDKVNDVFYTNANPDSTADFTAGPATATTLTATAAEIAAAGTLVLDIDEGDSVNLSSLKLYGKVKLVKTGKGTLVQDVSADWVCGIEVQDGRLQTTDALAASIKTDLSIKAGATVSIACTGAASATMPAAVSLEAGAKLLFDTTAFSGAGLEFTVGGVTFGEGATASECIATANPLYGATLESATLIRLDRLTAPITAVWTGNGTAGNFDDPGNWNCYNKLGGLLDNTTLPSADTVLFRLDADADWTAKGAIALGTGVTLDLNGHDLTAASITGDGVVTDTANQRWTLLQDVSGNFYAQLEYLETGTSFKNQYYHVAEYIDTGYQHNTKTVVDMKVQILKTTTDWFCYYGARNGAANEFSGWVYQNNHWKGVSVDGDSGKPYPKNVPFLAHMEFGGTCTFGNVEDSSTYLSFTSGAGGSSGRNDFLFALNQGSGNQFGMYGRIFYCTVKEKTDTAGVYHMIRDFVPAKRLSDGVLGMLDKYNGVFYVNNGSGAFIAGPYVTEGEATGAGELHVTVADGSLSLANMAKIAGNVKVVKDGAGTLVAPVGGQYFSGGIEVLAGTLSMGGALSYGGEIDAAAGTTVSVAASIGSAGTSVVNIAGGTFTVTGCGTSFVNGTVTLSGGAIGATGLFAPVSGTSAYSVALSGDATIDFTRWTGAFPLAQPALTFATGANIAVKLAPSNSSLLAQARETDSETGAKGGYLVEWSAIPEDVEFSLEPGSRGAFLIETRDGSLAIMPPAGFMIHIR